MAEFAEVVKQFNRMCSNSKCTADGCPLGEIGGDDCTYYAFANPEVFKQRVMDWAAEHPELVYPTWCEWLTKNGVLSRTENGVGDYNVYTYGKLFDRIPADIAEKLGIKPEEENP